MFDSIFTLVATFIAMIGALFVGLSVLIIARSIKTQSWPQVIGSVIYANVQKKKSSDSDGTTVTFHPYVKYEYSVSGVKFENDEYSAGILQSSREPSEAEIIVRQYPIGKKIPVFYCPSKPAMSVLIVGDSKGNWVLFTIAMALLIAGTIGALWHR